MANYVQLISRVMDDFDSIFHILVEKKVKLNSIELTDSMLDDGSVPTNQYAGLIDSLVNVEGLDGSTNTVSKITSTTAANYSLTAGTGTYTVTLSNLAAAGYYTTGDTGSSISADIDVQDLVFTDFTENKIVSGNYYVTPATNSLISSVTLPQGGVNIAIESSKVDNDLTLTLDSDADLFDNNKLQVEMGSTHSFGSGNAYSFTYTPKVTQSGTLTVDPTVTKTPGLIKESDVTSTGLEYTFTGDTSFDPITFNIKKGSVKLADSATNTGSATITAPTALTFLTPDENGKINGKNPSDVAYSLEASVGDVELTGEFEEGYVTSGNTFSLGSISVNSQTKYLKKGSVSEYSNAAVDMRASLGGLTNVTTTAPATTDADNYHKLTVGIGTTEAGITTTGTIDSGYITESSYSVKLNGTKDIYIKKGSYSATVTVGTSAASDNITISDSAISGGYKFTVTPTVGKTGVELDAGYIGSVNKIDITLPTAENSKKDFWIAQGTVNVNQTVSTKYHEFADDGKGQATEGEGSSAKAVDIFLNAAPTDRDYYTINPIVSASVTSSGYIRGSEAITGVLTPDATTDVITNITKYLPKANLKWQTSEDGQTSYLEVLDGGYLPSGLISEIDADSTPNMAVVNLAIGTGSASIFSSGVIAGGYKLTIDKAATGTAGYISSKAGEGSLGANEFYVKGGSLSVSGAAQTVTDTHATPTPVLATDNKTVTGYSIDVNGSVISTVDFEEGYIETANFKLGEKVYSASNKTITTPVAHTITLDKATIAPSAGSAKISLDVEYGTIETVTKKKPEDANPSNYFVTPTLSGSSTLTIETTRAGYLSESDTTEISILDDQNTLGATPVFIKTGTGGEISIDGQTAIVATPDFSDVNDNGKYEVTVSGTVTPSVVLDTGYYGNSEKTITNDVSVTGTTLEISKATASAVIGVTTEVKSTDITFIEDNTSPAAGSYVTVTADAPTVTNSISITDGYIKEGEGVAATKDNKNLTVTAVSKKIAKVTKYAETIGGSSDVVTEEMAEANASITIATANKYAAQDIVVTLTDHAMGKGVANELLILENRLAGKGRVLAES